MNGARGIIGVITNNRHEVFQRAIIRGVEALREPYQDNATVLVVRALD